MKKLIAVIALAFAAHLASAQTVINAAGCTQSQILSALNSITSNNTTVKVPSGTCTWTTPMTTFTTSFSFNLQGNGVVATVDSHGNPATYTDATIIIDGQTGTSGNPPIIDIELSGTTGQIFTWSGFTVRNIGHEVYNGELSVAGNSGTQARVFYNHFGDATNGIPDLTLDMYEPMTGVVDHNLFDVPQGQLYNGVRVYDESDCCGNGAWAAVNNLGTAKNIFIENNTWNQGFINDCEFGGTFVARYNTINVTTTNQNIGIQSHATGSQGPTGVGRGCRDWEAYNNWVAGVTNGMQYSLGFMTSGTGLWFQNTIASGLGYFDLALVDDRGNGVYSQNATPNGWGYCGTTFNGTGSNWDENTTTAGGYACIDQIGRGKGDLLSGSSFPSVVNSTTGTIAWPHQASEPVYVWNENYTPGNATVVTNSTNNNIQANRDYYAPASGIQTSSTSPFNGTVNTGWGTLANRPTTCTTGVGYGVQSGTTTVLYTCIATNTWNTYYTSYTYPHPLVQNLTTTTTTLTSSNYTPTAGASITLTATLNPLSGPTGTVQFFDGGTSLGTGTVASGIATKGVTAITAGVHSYTGTYSGDGTYSTSTSSPITVTASSGPTGGGFTPGVNLKGVVIK